MCVFGTHEKHTSILSKRELVLKSIHRICQLTKKVITCNDSLVPHFSCIP